MSKNLSKKTWRKVQHLLELAAAVASLAAALTKAEEKRE